MVKKMNEEKNTELAFELTILVLATYLILITDISNSESIFEGLIIFVTVTLLLWLFCCLEYYLKTRKSLEKQKKIILRID